MQKNAKNTEVCPCFPENPHYSTEKITVTPLFPRYE